MISKSGYRVWALSRAFQPIRSACGLDKALIQGFEVDDRYPSSNKYGQASDFDSRRDSDSSLSRQLEYPASRARGGGLLAGAGLIVTLTAREPIAQAAGSR
jgi:hypothetical protein